jgi:hypothetical protein
VAEGASQDFSIAVDKGYRIHVLQDNGVDVTSAVAVGKYPLSKITQAHTLSLTFWRRFDLTGKTNGNGSITPVDSSADSLANVTYRFQPKSGRYRFNGFWDFGKPVKPASETAHTFPAITSAHACSVAFLRMFKVEGQALNAGGTVAPDADAFVDSLASRIFTITPDPLVSGSGYRVDSVWDNGNLVATTGTDPYGPRKYQIDSIKADHVLKVKFKRYHVLKAIVESGDVTGKIDPGSVIVDEGGQQDYKYGPAGGYYAATLTDNGIPVPVAPGGGAYSIPKVGEPHNLVLTFRNTVTVKLFTNIPGDSKVQPILCIYGKEKSNCTETGSVDLELPYGSSGTIEAEKHICTDGSDICRIGIPFSGWRDSDNPEKVFPENPKELFFDRNQAWEAVYDLKAVP